MGANSGGIDIAGGGGCCGCGTSGGAEGDDEGGVCWASGGGCGGVASIDGVGVGVGVACSSCTDAATGKVAMKTGAASGEAWTSCAGWGGGASGCASLDGVAASSAGVGVASASSLFWFGRRW